MRLISGIELLLDQSVSEKDANEETSVRMATTVPALQEINSGSSLGFESMYKCGVRVTIGIGNGSFILPHITESPAFEQIPSAMSSLGPGIHTIEVLKENEGSKERSSCTLEVDVQEHAPSADNPSIVPAQGVYILPRPYIPRENTSSSFNLTNFKTFASYNPSMVSYNNRTYWYQRYSSYNLCGLPSDGLPYTTTLSLLCSVPIGASIPFCQPVLPKKQLPFESNCSRVRGIEDIRLFAHSSGLYGLGSYYKYDICLMTPVLIKFDAKSHEAREYVSVHESVFTGYRHEKNWIVVHGSEGRDGQMAVIKRRDPLSVALIDVNTGLVSGFEDFKHSHSIDLSLYGPLFKGLDLRGSSSYIPFKNVKGRKGLLTTLHVAMKEKGKGFGYLNLFVFTKNSWPYQTISHSRLFYLHDLGLVFAPINESTWRRPEFKADDTQFLSGLAYADQDMKTVLIGYGETDCWSKVMKISTEAVRRLI